MSPLRSLSPLSTVQNLRVTECPWKWVAGMSSSYVRTVRTPCLLWGLGRAQTKDSDPSEMKAGLNVPNVQAGKRVLVRRGSHVRSATQGPLGRGEQVGRASGPPWSLDGTLVLCGVLRCRDTPQWRFTARKGCGAVGGGAACSLDGAHAARGGSTQREHAEGACGCGFCWDF